MTIYGTSIYSNLKKGKKERKRRKKKTFVLTPFGSCQFRGHTFSGGSGIVYGIDIKYSLLQSIYDIV